MQSPGKGLMGCASFLHMVLYYYSSGVTARIEGDEEEFIVMF